jgi:hypothetical protein
MLLRIYLPGLAVHCMDLTGLAVYVATNLAGLHELYAIKSITLSADRE